LTKCLKEKYRQILTRDGKEKVTFIHLEGDKSIILERMERRNEHFFPSGRLESQFNALEVPLNAIIVHIDKTPEEICMEIVESITNSLQRNIKA